MMFSTVVQHSGLLYGTLPIGADRLARFPLQPFMGVMGVAPAADEPVHSVPPGPHGGNIDVNLLTVGSTLYLPVQVDGALFHTGDPHYAQGDGEVALTAMEASLRGTFRLSVLHEHASEPPSARWPSRSSKPTTTGFPWASTPTSTRPSRKPPAPPSRSCTRRRAWTRHGARLPDRGGRLEVSQVVDAVKGVHCVIRKADFRPW